MKTYMLKPNMTFATITTTPAPRKPADRQTEALVNALLPASTAKAQPQIAETETETRKRKRVGPHF